MTEENRTEPNLYELFTIFKSVALTGSFTKAGQVLGMPKSKVSRMISRLEKYLRLTLLTRTTRQQQLTNEGKIFFQNVIPLLDQMDQAIEISRNQKEQLRGRIRFTAPEDFGVELLGSCCSEFCKMFPDIQLELVVDNQHLDLIKDKIDLALRVGPLKNSSHLYAQKVAPVKMATIASDKWKKLEIKHPRDLKNIPYLAFSPNAVTQKKYFSSDKEKVTVEIIPAANSNNFFFLREMVRGNCGFAIVPKFIVDRYIVSGEVIQLIPDWQIREETLFVVNTSGKNMPVRIKTFADFLIKKLRSMI